MTKILLSEKDVIRKYKWAIWGANWECLSVHQTNILQKNQKERVRCDFLTNFTYVFQKRCRDKNFFFFSIIVPQFLEKSNFLEPGVPGPLFDLISINYNSIPFRKSQTPPFYAIYTLAFLKLLLVDRATFWGEAGTKKSCKKKSAPRKIHLRKFCFIENVCIIVLFSLYEVIFWFRPN